MGGISVLWTSGLLEPRGNRDLVLKEEKSLGLWQGKVCNNNDDKFPEEEPCCEVLVAVGSSGGGPPPPHYFDDGYGSGPESGDGSLLGSDSATAVLLEVGNADANVYEGRERILVRCMVLVSVLAAFVFLLLLGLILFLLLYRRLSVSPY